MMFINLRRTLTRIVSIMIMVSGFVILAPINANAADDVTLTCKKSLSDAVLDFRSLGINISAAVPVGTVVHSGNLTVTFKCALDNLQQFLDGLTAEVYLKRKTIAEDALGYGLTIYTGYGGEMSTDAAIIPTGNKIATYALTSGGTVGSYTEVTLNVPFQIVRTSNSMAGPNLLPDYVNVFDVGSLVPGNDLKLYVRYIKSGITVRDQTCSAAGDVNPKVSLGSYTANTSSGLGSGIGQTSPSTAFNLLLNCEALLSGTFDVMMQLDGDAADGLSDVGVVSLNSTSTASGVGVQILNESQQPVALATPYRVAAYPLSSALITVPLYARYYQTAATITPGSANAVATYTISYQ